MADGRLDMRDALPAHAYVIGAIDLRTWVLDARVDVFSEETPTLRSRWPIVFLQAQGATYEEACRKLRDGLLAPERAWLRARLSDRACRSLGLVLWELLP